ncbi:MAG: IS1 family transposase [Acidobacteriota bacterium]|nr:IS1 family transposase [Acidobacteriota bacterium]
MDKKKVTELPKLSETLVEVSVPMLELDKLWSFVLQKARKCWIWFALCRQPRQVVAYVVGDRSAQTCRRLWEEIPDRYRRAHCYTDFWEAYAKVLPATQHTAVGKEPGQTARGQAVESDVATAVGALCAPNFIVLEIIGDARGVFTPFHSSLQLSSRAHPDVSHYLYFYETVHVCGLIKSGRMPPHR